ncbi:hypothetical protein [Streptomyces cyaneofuscatus]|uniref:hypothetical protein n=1 Tax=Streptomyces cyaneofuscatus TaxID=66883 RepID=UPI00379B35F6
MTSNNVNEAESIEPSEAVVPKSMDDRLIDSTGPLGELPVRESGCRRAGFTG